MNAQKQITHTMLRTLFLGTLLLALLSIGCSTDLINSGPVSSTADPAEASWNDPCDLGPEYCYPAVPETGPAPGWTFLRYTDDIRSAANGLDDGDDDGEEEEDGDEPPPTFISRVIRSDQNGVFNLLGNQLVIPAGAIPGEQLLVSMAVPDPGTAIVDFGPHGTLFNMPVILRLNLDNMDMPEGMTGEDMAIWYINDDGEYILFEGTVHTNGQWLETTTNHFSRYIIAVKTLY